MNKIIINKNEKSIFKYFHIENLKNILNKLKTKALTEEYEMLYKIDED